MLEIEAAAARASEQLGRPVRHLRKDFWLTEVLRACAKEAQTLGVTVIFKGGTSLSKVFALIDRFSEDVDLLVVAPGGSAAVDRVMKSLVRAVESATGLIGQPEVETSAKGEYRACYFQFPNSNPGDRGVKLELGNRGGASPSSVRTISSPVAEIASTLLGQSVDEAVTFQVAVLSPARTLVEKLVILHEAHYRDSPQRDVRVQKVVRHYYDVHQLLQNNDVREELKAIGTMITARDVCQHSKALAMNSTTYPQSGFASSNAFNYGATVLQRNEYAPVLREYLWPGSPLPTFRECIEVVQEYRDIL